MVTIGLACMSSWTRSADGAARPRPAISCRWVSNMAIRSRAVAEPAQRFRDAGQEELHPGLPSPRLALLQEPVVVVAPGFQEQAEIEDRLAQHPRLAEDQRDEQPTQAPIAVEKRVDRLELDVGQARPDERGQRRILAVQEALERIEAFVQSIGRRRHEQGVAGPGSADPVLRAAKFARLLRCAPARLEQDGVHFADQPERQRKSAPHPGDAMLNRRDVVRNLGHVVESDGWRLVIFEQQQSNSEDCVPRSERTGGSLRTYM